MLNKQFEQKIDSASHEQLCSVLKLLLKPHASPVFGASKAIEHEVAALNALRVLGYIDRNSDDFDLVEKLRITKSKARSLLYQASLREENDSSTNEELLRKAISNPRIVKEGKFYLVEIPDPLTMDRLRKRIRDYGFLSDGSFSGSIAKITEEALLKLVEDLIPDELKKEIEEQLIKSGMPNKSLTGILKGMMAQAGKKIAGEIGGEVANSIGASIGEVLKSGWNFFEEKLNNNEQVKTIV